MKANAKKHKLFLKPRAEESQGRQEKEYDIFFLVIGAIEQNETSRALYITVTH